MLTGRPVLGRIDLLLTGFFFIFFSPPILARMLALDTTHSAFSSLVKITALPNLEQCTHKTGRLWFTVTNHGVLGNRRNVFLRDCVTGGLTSSAEFPGGSGIEYLFQGALWIGGIVGNYPDIDTLVSVGNDGWVNIQELFPEAGANGVILHRSANPASPYYSPEAVSDQDLIATYYDTLKDLRVVTTPDPETGELHKPLGLKVVQKSYSWAANWGQDWMLLDYTITNIGNEPIREAYVGLLIDPDIGHDQGGRFTYLDDYSALLSGTFLKIPAGFFGLIPSENLFCRETLNIAYAYDNDGDPEEDGRYGTKSPTGALGVRVLQAGEALRLDGTLKAKLSFNWWVPDSSGALDWGPQKFPGRVNIFNGRGQPTGDRMRYSYLSNREIDYDQIYSAIDYRIIDPFSLGQWRPPHPSTISSIDIANGADTRFVLSVGPLDLGPGENLPVTVAVMAGAGFQGDPANFAANFSSSSDFLDPVKISAYKSRLNLTSLIENARMARKVFDNETVQSPVFCRFWAPPINDSGAVHGDGIPDFKGPPPPPFPKVEYATSEGEVTIRWFGKETETAVDPISGLSDFEGYRVEMSTDGVNYTTVAYADKVDWRVWYLNRDFNGNGFTDPDNTANEEDDTVDVRWAPARNQPLTYEEIQNYYAVRWDTCLNKPGSIQKPIDPMKFNSPIRVWGSVRPPLPGVPFPNPWCNPGTNQTAIRVRFCNNCGRGGVPMDTILYFQQEGHNFGLGKMRMYPSVTNPANDSAYWYQFKMTGLFPSQPVWFAIVPFDNGMLTYYQRIDPQATAVSSVAQMLYPIATDSARRADSLKISVYPNPYRIDHDYSYFEKRLPVSGRPQSSQKINFINLPPRCTIRIYTLDGDLVQQINHDKAPNTSDAGYEFWDLLTRNAQPVVAGLYLYTVESAEGRYIGKIIIIQ